MALLFYQQQKARCTAGGQARRRAGKESSAKGYSRRHAIWRAPGWCYWMQQRQPDWLCSHSSSLRVEQRPTEGSYSTT
jgi:hypothetical protein